MHQLIIITAKYFVVIPVIALGWLFFSLDKAGRVKLLLITVLAGILSLLLAKIGGHFYSDPRPFIADHISPLITGSMDNGFPSDHTLLSACIGFIILLFNKKLGAVLLIIAALIGTARVAAGVHHLPDILGAFVIAGAGVALAAGTYQLMQKYRTN